MYLYSLETGCRLSNQVTPYKIKDVYWLLPRGTKNPEDERRNLGLRLVKYVQFSDSTSQRLINVSVLLTPHACPFCERHSDSAFHFWSTHSCTVCTGHSCPPECGGRSSCTPPDGSACTCGASSSRRRPLLAAEVAAAVGASMISATLLQTLKW